ncbi:hypothetical protein [Parasphingorhabdus sp.]|uniref:hypothetical protein n=1 Tax=Parasphingorhabdus sp. TaxID=2709688 RepID=UPI003A91DE32
MNRKTMMGALVLPMLMATPLLAQSGSVLEGQSTSDRLARDVADIQRVGGNNANGRQSSSEREQRTSSRYGESRSSDRAVNDSGRSSGKPD